MQMAFALFRVAFQFLRRLFSNLIRQHLQRSPGLQGADIRLGSAFEIVLSGKRIGHRIADNHDAVVAHDHHFLLWVGEELRTAFALFFERQTAIVSVNDVSIEERRTVLVDGRQARVFKAGQNGRMD